MKTLLFLLFLSFNSFAQITLEDPQDLLSVKVDSLIQIKDAKKLFPCNSHSTHRRFLEEIKYTCFPTYCETEFWRIPSFVQQEVVECSKDSRYVVDSNGNSFEFSDEYLKSINYNMIRHFVLETIPLLFPENGKVVIKKVVPSTFIQFRGFPFARKIPSTSVHIAYHPFPGLYGFQMEIKFAPEMNGLNQILEFDLEGDLWSEYAF